MSTIEELISDVQTHCKKSRVRITEFFLDFDKLRSGFVSRDQFRRCLHMLGIGARFKEADFLTLYEQYKKPNDPGRVSYVKFCTDVDAIFTLKGLEKSPHQTIAAAPPLATKRRANALTPEQWEKFEMQQNFFIQETVSRGLNLKEFFKDFDHHCSGRVTAPQFQRCFPFRVDQPTIDIIIKRYQDPSGDIHYSSWVTDVEDAIASRQVVVRPVSRTHVTQRKADHTVESLILDLQKQVLTNRIRVDEAFKDFDKLRSGLISESQFASGLGSLKFQKFTLQPNHIEMLVDWYTATDSYGVKKVSYVRFVNDMESVFTEKGLEKTPLRTVGLRTDILKTETYDLSDAEEARVSALLDKIRTMIRTRRILLKPFFQDFDRANKGIYQTQYTTRARFERVLGYVGISLTANDFTVLCDKYSVRDAGGNTTENIRYNAFCRDVDSLYNESENANSSIAHNATSNMPNVNTFIKPGKSGRISIEEVEEDIQAQCMSKRVRIHEYFRDFDTLRSGNVTKGQFQSAMTIAGLHLDPQEYELLFEKYQSTARPDSIRWLAFADAMDEVFTTKRLEQDPGKSHSNLAGSILNKRAVEAQPTMNEEVAAILKKIRELVQTRGIQLPPFFKDFDRHNHGRISAAQFEQVLARHQFNLTERELHTLVDCYKELRTRSINYRTFVRDIDSTENPYANQNTKTFSSGYGAARQAAPTNLWPLKPSAALDVETIISQIQSKVAKDRIRVREFMLDSDKLRKGYIPRAKFRTGLDMAGIKLEEQQLQILEAQFDNPRVANTVNYMELCDILDSVFGDRGLEKDPTRHTAATQLLGRHPLQSQITPLDDETESAVQTVLGKVQTLIRNRRMHPKPYFQDYDKIRKERVTPTQFGSVLDKMQINLTPKETQLLVAQFVDERGDVDYKLFCSMIDPNPV